MQVHTNLIWDMILIINICMKKIIIIDHPRNRGYGSAIKSGIISVSKYLRIKTNDTASSAFTEA